MLMRLPVVAVTALALLPARHSRPKTLAIVLAAGRFLACAFSPWDKGWHAWKVARVPEVGHPLSVINPRAVAMVIPAASADAVFTAGSASGKAFTVELKAIYFGTFAAGCFMIVLDGHSLPVRGFWAHGVSFVEGAMGPSNFLIGVNELFEEVSAGVLTAKAVFVDLDELRLGAGCGLY